MSDSLKVINGYTLTQEFSNKNAGTCQWSFCEKGGSEYFIKQFLSPKYPLDSAEISPKQKEKKRRLADSFYAERKAFYSILDKCRTGNIVVVNDFFRWESCYYAVSDKIDTSTVPISCIAALDDDKKRTLMRSVLHSVKKLHENGIVHSDIKPDNVIVKATDMGFYTAKLIDFESSFLESAPPDIPMGDQIYLSPEAAERINDEDNEKHIRLTSKADIFALGILFHEYWSGRRPTINESEYNYVHEAVLDRAAIRLAPSVPPDISSLLERMLAKAPENRPSASEILSELAAKPEKKDSSAAYTAKAPTGPPKTRAVFDKSPEPAAGNPRIRMNFPSKGIRPTSPPPPPPKTGTERELPKGFYISDDLD